MNSAFPKRSEDSLRQAIEEPIGSSASVPKEEQQLNVWVDKDLVKRLKVKGALANKSLKKMVTEALEQFL